MTSGHTITFLFSGRNYRANLQKLRTGDGAIGVTKSLKTASSPLITKPTVPLKDLAMGVMMGAHDTDTVSSLAGRLARLNKQLEPADHARITEKSGGVALTTIVSQLFNAIDADAIEAKAREFTTQPKDQPVTAADEEKAQAMLVKAAATVVTGPLIELIDTSVAVAHVMAEWLMAWLSCHLAGRPSH